MSSLCATGVERKQKGSRALGPENDRVAHPYVGLALLPRSEAERPTPEVMGTTCCSYHLEYLQGT